MPDNSSPRPASGGSGGGADNSSPRPAAGGSDGGVGVVPTNILWVGNIVADTTDADLMGLFAEYGALDCTANHSSRSWSFAFVYFKDASEAQEAREALQGHVLLGSPIKIDFCHAFKAGKHVWVGGISSNVSKERLEDEFKKFGRIQDFRFFRDRNTAIISYIRLNDAISAVRSMKEKRLDGEVARVDYLRSKPNQRYGWSEYYERKWEIDDNEGPQTDATQRQSHEGGQIEGQPSKTLWIRYPSSIQIDEQMLRNAMILFGEIRRIKSFPSRHYSFVEFRSVDEACRAMAGLQGRLFNDPRIHIKFSKNEHVSDKEMGGLVSVRPFSDLPFGPGSVELAHPCQIGPHNFPGLPPSNGISRPYFRSSDPLDFEPHYYGPDTRNDLSGQMGSHRRKLSYSTKGMLPTSGMETFKRQPEDGYDANYIQRESKILRFDGPSANINVQVPIHDSPLVGRGPSIKCPTYIDQPSFSETNYFWRGVIAKGGCPVCHARCISTGKGIKPQMPTILNCSAKTGLDMLTEHYREAAVFNLIYFLPDCEDDFAPYTEFLHYLGERNKAGVAKFDDDTTLFLVPPSLFLTKVLNVSGPERLYGVVLKLPLAQPKQCLVSSIGNSEYSERSPVRAQSDFSLSVQKEDHGLQINYGDIFHGGTASIVGCSKPLVAGGHDSVSMQLGPMEYESGILAVKSKNGVSLTPEPLATLSALIPVNKKPTATNVQLPLSLSVKPPLPSYPTATISEKVVHPYAWRQNDQLNIVSHSQQLKHQYDQSSFLSQMPANSAVENPTQAILSDALQVLEKASRTQSSCHIPSVSLSNVEGSAQEEQLVLPQAVQQFWLDAVHAPVSQPSIPYNTSAALQSGSTLQSQISTHGSSNLDSANHAPQPQPQRYVSAFGQSEADAEAAKALRYQSTLQFAANILLQMRQQQQRRSSAQAMQGSHSQQ